MGVEGIKSLQLITPPNLQKGGGTNLGMMTFSIYASENIRPLVKVCFSGVNKEERDIDVKWAWQNNGDLSPPVDISLMCSPVSFPLSNSGRLIDKIKGQPEVLNAKLFIAVQSSKQTGDIDYHENIEIEIEYN
jgi:hypothetical protein